jgi:hypothetical protein
MTVVHVALQDRTHFCNKLEINIITIIQNQQSKHRPTGLRLCTLATVSSRIMEPPASRYTGMILMILKAIYFIDIITYFPEEICSHE